MSQQQNWSSGAYGAPPEPAIRRQGPPPGPPGPPDSRRRTSIGKLAVVILAGALVGGGVAWALTRGGDEAGASPPEVMQAYLDAFAEHDCERMAELATKESLDAGGLSVDDATQKCRDTLRSEQVDLDFSVDKIEVVTHEGDSTVVRVTITSAGQRQSKDVTLDYEDGDWKIDLRTMEGRSDPAGGDAGTQPTTPTTSS